MYRIYSYGRIDAKSKLFGRENTELFIRGTGSKSSTGEIKEAWWKDKNLNKPVQAKPGRNDVKPDAETRNFGTKSKTKAIDSDNKSRKTGGEKS